MAIQDIGQGWGDLKCSLTEWHCPKCKVNFPIQAWEICNGEVNGHRIVGRSCPDIRCDFKAFGHSDTKHMIPVIVAIVVKPDPKPVVKPTAKPVSKPVVKKPVKAEPKKVVKKAVKGKPK